MKKRDHLPPLRTSKATLKPADLGRRDWLEAGQSLLKKGGLRALKLRALAHELKVSTGSFYHHFSDFDAYQGLLAAYFSGEQIEGILTRAGCGNDPRQRIENLVDIVQRENLTRLGLAMRAWGESDKRARVSVEGQDRAVLAFLNDNLTALGFSDREARLRSYALVAVGLGMISGTNALTPRELRIGLLELLSGRGPSAGA